MREKIVAGNWKMNKTFEEGLTLASAIRENIRSQPVSQVSIVVAPPYPYLEKIGRLLDGSPDTYLAAQNCHQESTGAFTGEVSADMLKSVGAGFVILGHSERREYFKESNELLARKVDAALKAGLRPIFCCGEPLSIRESGDHVEFVNQQLTASLFHLGEEAMTRLVIAYEPIWAIGTGKTASAIQAQEMHQNIRKHVATKFGGEIAEDLSILYGGSCKPSNARELFQGPDVDGGLIGGASLTAEDFMAIVRSF